MQSRHREVPKCIAQIFTFSPAIVSTLQQHWSKTSKLMRFVSLHFRPVVTGEFWGSSPQICCAQKTFFKHKRNTKILPLIICVFSVPQRSLSWMVHLAQWTQYSKINLSIYQLSATFSKWPLCQINSMTHTRSGGFRVGGPEARLK